MAHWLAPLTKVPCRVYRLVSIAGVPPGRGARRPDRLPSPDGGR
jgi:hypothetical protein